MKINNFLLLTIALCVFANYSCTMPVLIKANTGSIKICTTNDTGSKSLGVSRNLHVWGDAPVKYHVTGSGPADATINKIVIVGETNTIDALDSGEWNLTVESIGSDDKAIARGTATVIVKTGETVNATFVLCFIEGIGSVEFEIKWESGEDISSAEGVLHNIDGTSKALNFQLTAQTALCKMSDLPAGTGYSYDLCLKASNGSLAYGSNGTIHITNERTSAVSIQIAKGELMVPPSAPENVIASLGRFCVDLSWTDSLGESTYLIERRAQGNSWETIVILPENSISHRDTSMLAEKQYDYRVVAIKDDIGETTSAIKAISTPRFSDIIVKNPVAFGLENAYRILSNGTVMAFGINNHNQLGSFSSDIKPNGIVVNGLPKILAVKTDDLIVLALDENGNLWQWGNNDAIPKKVMGIGRPIVDFSMELNSYYAIDADGKVWTWGINNDGQLGDGTKISKSIPSVINNLPPIEKLSSNGRSVLAVTFDGLLYAWGVNYFYQLGLGDNVDKLVPTLVPGITGVKDVKTSFEFQAMGMIVLQNGSVFAAGNSSQGLIGLPEGIYSTFTEIPNLSNIINVEFQDNAILAVNSNGELFISGSKRSSYPALTSSNKNAFVKVTDAPQNITYMYFRESKFYFETSSGNKYSCGTNYYGELLQENPSIHPYPVKIVSPSVFKTIVATNSMFYAIDLNGSVWSWGNSISTLPTNGQVLEENRPVKIFTKTSPVIQIAANGPDRAFLLEDGSVYGLSGEKSLQEIDTSLGYDIAEIAIGGSIYQGEDHMLFRKKNGTVWSYGYNKYGQLGNGTTTNSSVAVQVKAQDGASGFLENVCAISANENFSMALLADGKVVCWGNGSGGLLGDSRTNNTFATFPVSAVGISGVTSISAGKKIVFALQGSKVWYWGDSKYIPTNYYSTYASPVSPVKFLAQTSSQNNTLIGILENGSCVTKGYNAFCLLGYGRPRDDSGWIVPFSSNSIVSVAMTEKSAAALSSTGDLWTWGSNDAGQAGDGTVDSEYINTPQLLNW